MTPPGFCSSQCPAVSTRLASRRKAARVCSRRRGAFAAVSANVTLDNERESSCSVINFDAPGQQFALHQAIAVVNEAGLNTMRISISTDDDMELVKSEFLVTNGNGKLAEVDFEPIRSHLSALSGDKTAVETTTSVEDGDAAEYQFVEELQISEDDLVLILLEISRRESIGVIFSGEPLTDIKYMERGLYLIVDNYAHPKYTTVTMTGPTGPDLSRKVMDVFASENVLIRFCTLHTLNTENEAGTDIYHVTNAQGAPLSETRRVGLHNMLFPLVVG